MRALWRENGGSMTGGAGGLPDLLVVKVRGLFQSSLSWLSSRCRLARDIAFLVVVVVATPPRLRPPRGRRDVVAPPRRPNVGPATQVSFAGDVHEFTRFAEGVAGASSAIEFDASGVGPDAGEHDDAAFGASFALGDRRPRVCATVTRAFVLTREKQTPRWLS